MNQAIDYSTVKWVKQELDATLRQARQALTTYVENLADDAQLRVCAVHLHQVYGTLHMVELYGAALLAEEMEQVVDALLADTVGQKQDAYELVMRGMLQLPDYLERLIAGGRDLPLALLPLLNDLRAIRGQKLLSENSLFSPDLHLPLPAAARRSSHGDDSPTTVRKQRHGYQVALLGWYRNQDVAVNLQRIGTALDTLQAVCTQDAAQRLWWIAGGMVSALREGWLEASIAPKLLLGQVDRQIKRLIDEGEAGILSTPPDDLLKNLLFYVARAKDGGEPVSLIKQTYGLSALLPDSEELERAQHSLTGHNAELMSTVAAAIKEDLARVKDTLDLFLRGGRKTVADLQPASETLNRIADTLGMLGLGALRKVIQVQAQTAADMGAGRRDSDETALMDVAAALLHVESALEGMARGSAAEPECEAIEQPGTMSMPASEFNQVRGVVAGEALRDIIQAKDAILAFMEDGTDFSVLENIPQLFHQIKGGMLLLNENRAAALIDAVCGYITERMLAERQIPVTIALDDLADAISGIEYYLESLREGTLLGHAVLGIAEKSLASLGQVASQPAAEQPVPTAVTTPPSFEYQAEALALEDTDFVKLDLTTLADVAADVADEAARLADADAFALAGDDAFGSDEIIVEVAPALPATLDGFNTEADAFGMFVANEGAELPLSAAADEFSTTDDAFGAADLMLDAAAEDMLEDTEPAPPPAEPTSQVVVLPIHPVMSGDIDAEILEIFLEESDEELASLSDCLPRWLADEQDHDALVTMRRSYHTLKGSGRLVGALRLGEFAWGYESLLNRVLDGVLLRDETVCGLLDRALLALPELIAQVRDGTVTTQPIEALMNMAHALSRGEAVSLTDLVAPHADGVGSTEAAAVIAPAMDAVAEDIAPGLDMVDAFAMEVESGYADVGETAREGIDPVLYGIFCTESQDHIATIRNYLVCCRDRGVVCRVTDDLMRALHTLHGSARMAGAEAIAELAYEIEKYAKALRIDQLPMSVEGMELTGQATHIIETMLVELNVPDGACIPNAEIIAAIASLPRTTRDVGHIPSAEVPSDPDEIDVVVDEATDVISGFADADVFATLDEAPEFELPMVDDAFATLDGLEVADVYAEAIPPLTEIVTTVIAAEADEMSDVTEESESGSQSYFVETAGVAVHGVALAVDAEGEWVTFDAQDTDADLLEVFLEEGDEILGAIDTTLQNWMRASGDNASMAELQRHLHTLKGGSRMANITAIGDLSHALESLLIAVVDGEVTPHQTLFDLLMAPQDSLTHMLEAVRAQRPMRTATSLIEQLEAMRQGRPVAETETAAVPTFEPAESARDYEASAVAPQAEAEVTAYGEEIQKFPGRIQQEQVRVRADLLDNMVNFAGEISIYRSRLEQQVGSMRFNLSELGQTVVRMRDQLRQVEIETEAQVLFRYEREGGGGDEHFDPLEMDRYSHLQQLSRSMLESVGDLVSIQRLLDNITRESETLLLQQARVNTELQEGLMHTRMVPFSVLAPRMRRILRQACQELGKRAELSLEGAQGEIDRTVVDRIIAPIEHMLRNALAHGIETPEHRRAAGKREAGSIRVSLMRDGSEVVIQLADDGAGMNLDVIRRKAKERGLIVDDAEVSDNDVMQFILEPGFSTAEQVSQISGRGVGMDVVSSEVKQLGGSLHIDSRYGQGTIFTIRLPFTLAISRALLVQVHEEVYAIPLTSVEGIVRMRQDELSRYFNDATARFEYDGQNYPVQNLGALLGQGAPVLGLGGPKRLPVLLVRSGDHRMALQVESLLGSRETVVKSVGPQISTVRGISGATILGDGRVVLILDLGGLLRTGGLSMHTERVATAITEEKARVLRVMVVDDSITVRKVTTRLLERNDMHVITAKDGVDAVAKLQEHIPDVLLLDIEMPRMDGFELATHVRNEPRLRNIPMIMITSRTGDKHRKRAMEIGVDRYLGKPFQESELLSTIHEFSEGRRPNA